MCLAEGADRERLRAVATSTAATIGATIAGEVQADVVGAAQGGEAVMGIARWCRVDLGRRRKNLMRKCMSTLLS
jgi:hypothetical protein